MYNPCDTDKIRSLAESPLEETEAAFFDEGPVVVSMGREDDVKGYWHLVKSFALMKKEISGAKLMIIGEGSFTEYKKLAEDLGIADSVWFTGVKKNPFAYLQKASLFIMTSIMEGFPNALVEAMAVGVAVMSVNCKTGPSEILSEHYETVTDNKRVYRSEYGVLLPVISPVKNLAAGETEPEEQVMAKEAVRILQNEDILKSMQAAGRKRSETFSVQRYLERLADML